MSYTTFREAYGALKAHAETLRSQQEPNIDDLLRIVEDSVAAFKVCQQRIDAVEKALEAALNEMESGEWVERGEERAGDSDVTNGNDVTDDIDDDDAPW